MMFSHTEKIEDSSSVVLPSAPLVSSADERLTDEDAIGLLEERVQRDEGKRGIAPLVQATGKGQLYAASKMVQFCYEEFSCSLHKRCSYFPFCGLDYGRFGQYSYYHHRLPMHAATLASD